ncbi:MAG: hypothetical protein GXX86_11470, partial [Propionibacterium sp.]|nr:hypothetical protein [Propionibacterium sp.]
MSLAVAGLALSLVLGSSFAARAAEPEPEPLLSFPVISDVHINSGDKTANNLANAMVQFEREMPRLDVIAGVGDLVHGHQSEMEKYQRIMSESPAAGVPQFLTMGNHEFDQGRIGAVERFNTHMGQDGPLMHKVYNGFHFIGIGWDMGPVEIGYLKRELAVAAEAAPDQPIFVFFHYPLQDTVYGSEKGEWGTANPLFHAALAEYPQAITFSGHSHYPGENPRNIWQGDFTALNTGIGLNYLEMEKMWAQGGFPPGTDTLAQALGVEVYSDEVVIKRRDITRDEWFGEEWVIPLPIDKANFTYTDDRDSIAPVFPETAAVSVQRSSSSAIEVTWDIATDNSGFINGYYLRARNTATGAVDAERKISSEYWKRPVPSSHTWELAGLAPGVDYAIEVVAVDAFFNESAPLSTPYTTDKLAIADAWTDEQAVELGMTSTHHVVVTNADTVDREVEVSVDGGTGATFAETSRTITVPAGGRATADFTVTGGSERTTTTLTSTVTGDNGAQLGTLTNLLYVGYVYGESFDRLASDLGPAVDENISVLGFTHQPPTGWARTLAEGMAQGTEEWQGWSFTTLEFWVAAEDQGRSGFSKAHNVFAVADSDEWDDTGSPARESTFDSTLSTPDIPVTAGEAYELVFDSHYQDESPQRAQLSAVHTDAEGNEVSRAIILDYGPEGA